MLPRRLTARFASCPATRYAHWCYTKSIILIKIRALSVRCNKNTKKAQVTTEVYCKIVRKIRSVAQWFEASFLRRP